jgi:hypothetical protein
MTPRALALAIAFSCGCGASTTDEVNEAPAAEEPARAQDEPRAERQAAVEEPTQSHASESELHACLLPEEYHRCNEYTPAFPALASIATDMCEEWRPGACPRENLVGVCERLSGFRQYLYAPQSLDEARETCDSGTFHTAETWLARR